MTDRISIDFDTRTRKLVVRCPVWSNDLITAMDARSWSKAQKAWLIPISRANVTYLTEKLITPGLAEITDAARANMVVAPPKTKGDSFPAWYKFKTEPRKQQRMALRHYGMSALALFMIMRAGKSKVAIDMACAYRMEAKIEAMLIVCKLSVRRTWVEQFGLHAPIPSNIFLPDSASSKAFDRWLDRTHDFPVLVIGTESLSQGGMYKMAERFMLARKDPLMTIDESSMISNHKAARSQACLDLGKMAKYRIAMTGTPMSVGPMNLFMQFEFLDSNIIGIGDFYAFRNRYAVMGGYHVEIRPGVKKPTQIVGYQNLDELTRLIAPYTYEVGEDELDLPEKVPEKRYVKLQKRQQALYDTIKKERAYNWKGEDVIIKNVLELVLRLHQVVGGYTVTRSRDERGRERSVPHVVVEPKDNPKIAELLDVIEEAGKRQGIVWCAYRPELDAVVTTLRSEGLRVGEIHGGIEEDDRETTRQKFQRRELDWIVANAATGSMGLDMSAASITVFYSNTNRMIDRKQAGERPRAVGKKGSILEVDIVAEGTVDEIMMKALEAKMDLSEYVQKNLREVIAVLSGDWQK